jgi:hypothetical protein
MKIFQRHLVLALLLATVGGPAQATLITIDATNYSVGTDVSNAAAGATLSTFTNVTGAGATFEPVLVGQNPFGSDLAPRAFTHVDFPGPNDLEWNFHNARDGAQFCLQFGECDPASQRFYALHASFAAPTNYVAVNVHYDNTGYDGSVLRAFDALGNVVSTCRVWGASIALNPRQGLFPSDDSPECGTLDRRYSCDSFNNCAADFTAFVSLPDPDIAFVLWGSAFADSTWASISSLTFRSVPEPASFGLLVFGVLLAAVMRRRRLQQA